MVDPVKALETEALKLVEEDRAELARILLLSLGASEDQETEREWAQEAERRYLEIEAGLVEAIPSVRVLEQARSRLE